MQVSLSEKIAVVTGAASGIGLATVLKFVEAGAAGVVAVDLAEAAPEKLSGAIAAGKVVYVPGDVGKGETAERFDPVQQAQPLALPGLRAVPASAISADAESGELSAPLGSIQHLADSVLALARAVGGRSVATATFATADPRTPLTLAARDGEDVVLELAGRHFSLPAA